MRLRARALALASALTVGGLALTGAAGAALADEGPSAAGDPLDACSTSGGGIPGPVETDGASWFDICPTSGTIGEAETVNKYDALDEVGSLIVRGDTNVPVLAPAGEAETSYDGTTFTSTFIDQGVDLGSKGIVDVTVVLTIQGSYATWQVSATDSLLGAPVNLSYIFQSDLGSDGDTLWNLDGADAFSYGDTNDPVLLWSLDADTFTYFVSDGDDNLEVEIAGEQVTVTLALLDYGCPSGPAADDAFYYATSILPTFAADFGATLAVPGTQQCVVVHPMTVTAGEPFVIEPTVELHGFDFLGGGRFFQRTATPEWITVEDVNPNVPGETPIARLVGTAPTTPGTYQVPLYVADRAGDRTSGHGILELTVVAPPQLAATGAESPWAVSLFALVTIGAGMLVILRPRRAA